MLTSHPYKYISSTLLLFDGSNEAAFLIHYLSHECDVKVVTLTVDVSGADNLDELEQFAYTLGSSKHVTIDALDELVEDFCAKTIRANGRYHGQHPVCLSLYEVLRAKIAARVCEQLQLASFTHHANSTLRNAELFRRAFHAHNDIKFFTPLVGQSLSQPGQYSYLRKNGIIIDLDVPYEMDRSIWGWEQEVVQDHVLLPCSARNKRPTRVTLSFQNGIPVAMDGVAMSLRSILAALDALGKEYAIGSFDSMVNRFGPQKVRIINQSPSAHCVLLAHKQLELCVMPRRMHLQKTLLDLDWLYNTELLLWFSEKQSDLNNKIAEFNTLINGDVVLLLEPNRCRVLERVYA